MLWTIFVILCILWLLGLMTGYTMGGVIPYPSGHRHRRGADQSHSGKKIGVAIWNLSGEGEVYRYRSNRYEKEICIGENNGISGSLFICPPPNFPFWTYESPKILLLA